MMRQRFERWRRSAELTRLRHAFELLLERRLWLFVALDLMLLLMGLFQALLTTGRFETIYIQTVVVPMLVLGVPVLSSVVALERRAGSLDLALAVPSTERYFLRRVVPVCAFLVAQGMLAILVGFLIVLQGKFFSVMLSWHGLGYLPLVVHCVEIGILLGAVSLFWGSRLTSAGAAMAASAVTLAVFQRWIFATPVFAGLGQRHEFWFGFIPPPLVILVWELAVPALAAAILYLYARERLRRPEAMLA